ncbi:MAG: hypothetical protein U1E43_07705 [Rhodospirillales bacterium]
MADNTAPDYPAPAPPKWPQLGTQALADPDHRADALRLADCLIEMLDKAAAPPAVRLLVGAQILAMTVAREIGAGPAPARLARAAAHLAFAEALASPPRGHTSSRPAA